MPLIDMVPAGAGEIEFERPIKGRGVKCPRAESGAPDRVPRSFLSFGRAVLWYPLSLGDNGDGNPQPLDFDGELRALASGRILREPPLPLFVHSRKVI